MELDKTDIRILSILQKDGRKSFREIAKELDISTPTISSKVSTLEELNIIKGYHADIDAEGLSETTIILIIKSSPADLENVAEQLKQLDNTNEVYIVSNSKIFLKVTFIDSSGVNNFLSRLTSIEKIQEYESYSIIDTIKETPRAIIQENLSITIKCYYCKKLMKDEPVKVKLDGKTHYVCCNTCAKQFKEKYEMLKSKI